MHIIKRKTHKLSFVFFYITIVFFIVILYYFAKETWILKGWIKYSNNSELKLNHFNSIFELCVAFCLAYTVTIRFRNALKKNAYGGLNNKISLIRQKSQLYILSTDRDYSIIQFILNNIVHVAFDIEHRLKKEETPNQHRAEDLFLYFGFYSLMCIMVGALTEGLSSRPFFFEVYFFLLLFSLVSMLSVSLRYIFIEKPSFTLTILLFVFNAGLSLSVARNVNAIDLHGVFYLPLGQKYFFSGANDFKTAANYCCLLCVFANLFPYVLFFSKLYYVFVKYYCVFFFYLFLLKIEEFIRVTISGLGTTINFIAYSRSRLADFLELLAKLIRGK